MADHESRQPRSEEAGGATDEPSASVDRRGANDTPVEGDGGVLEEGPAPSIPSSLNMDRHGSAARTGRAEMQERLDERNAVDPGIAGGDPDVDWESASTVGDEAPGGDNPTPDQDIVDEVGRALGIEYEDNEELKGAEKLEERDRRRWELDPASSDDWEDRSREKD